MPHFIDGILLAEHYESAITKEMVQQLKHYVKDTIMPQDDVTFVDLEIDNNIDEMPNENGELVESHWIHAQIDFRTANIDPLKNHGIAVSKILKDASVVTFIQNDDALHFCLNGYINGEMVYEKELRENYEDRYFKTLEHLDVNAGDMREIYEEANDKYK